MAVQDPSKQSASAASGSGSSSNNTSPALAITNSNVRSASDPAAAGNTVPTQQHSNINATHATQSMPYTSLINLNGNMNLDRPNIGAQFRTSSVIGNASDSEL